MKATLAMLGIILCVVLAPSTSFAATPTPTPTPPTDPMSNPESGTVDRDDPAAKTHVKNTVHNLKYLEAQGFAYDSSKDSDGKVKEALDAALNDLATQLGKGSADIDPNKLRDAFFIVNRFDLDRKHENAEAVSGSPIGADGVEIPIPGGFSLYGQKARIPVTHTDFIAPPRRVSFVTRGKNKLQDLQDELDQAKSKLKKIFPCTKFDWVSDFSSKFNVEALKDYVKDLGEGVASAAPMALLQAFSPNLAEIVKHFKVLVSFDLSANKHDCNSMQKILTPAFGTMMRGPGWATCVQNYENAEDASAQCGTDNTSFLGIDRLGKLMNPIDNFAGQASNLLSNVTNPATFDYDAVASGVNRWFGGGQPDDTEKSDRAAKEGANSNDADGSQAQKDQNAKHKVTTAWQGISSGAGSILKQTLGSFSFSPHAGVQVGTGTPRQWDLVVKAQAFKLSQDLVTDLQKLGLQVDKWCRQYPENVGLSDAQAMKDYHDKIAIYFHYTYKQPWLDAGYDLPEELMDVRFTQETIDKLAHLIFLLANYGKVDDHKTIPGAKTYSHAGYKIINEYRPVHAAQTIVKSELTQFFYFIIWKHNIESIREKIASEIEAGNNGGTQEGSGEQMKKAIERLDKRIADLWVAFENDYRKPTKELPLLIKKINEYELPKPGVAFDDALKFMGDMTPPNSARLLPR